MKNLITPPNPYAAPRMTYDYSVQTEVALIRWQEHATYKEIIERMQDRFDILIDHYAVETILKSYEIATAKTYRISTLEKIQQHGGLFVCVDVMEPLKGKSGFLVAYDYWTGLTLGAKKMPNGKQSTYEGFLRKLQTRIKTELDVPIIGIISDALPAQRKAIATVFQDVPHCLCHYHFYNFVLKSAKQVDSGIVTQIRKALRQNYDIRQFKFCRTEQSLARSQYEVLQPLFEPLEELSYWSRKPRDPCFTGLELWHRLADITHKFQYLKNRAEIGSIHLPKHSVKVLKRISPILEEILNQNRTVARELEQIHLYLGELVEILSQTESNASRGLKKMLHFIDRLSYTDDSAPRGTVETEFIQSLMKYINTKGEMLFNYRKIPDAPTTNNFQELKFKQLKHFLRRVIGHGAAKAYLMAHGEQIVFVDPRESRENIRDIFQSSNQSAIRKEIKAKRRSMDSWVIVVHNWVRWVDKLKGIDEYILNLEKKLIKKV